MDDCGRNVSGFPERSHRNSEEAYSKLDDPILYLWVRTIPIFTVYRHSIWIMKVHIGLWRISGLLYKRVSG